MTKEKYTAFRISPFTFLFAIIWWIMGNGTMFIVYFVCLILHEEAHAFVAKKLGYKTEKILISPLGASLYADTDEFTNNDEFKIALVGPLFSLSLSFICVCMWWIYPESYNYTMDFCMANFSIFLLNILPIFPLDGGRVLSSKLSRNLSRKNVAKIVNIITIIFSILLIFLSIISLFFKFNYTFGVVGCFLIISLVSGGRENSYKRVLSLSVKQRKLKRGLVRTQIMVVQSLSLAKIYSMLDQNIYYEIYVVDENFKTLFVVEEVDFIELIKIYPPATEIKDTHIDKSHFHW